MLRIPTLAFSLAESSPCRCPASRETIGPYIASLGKEQNSEFEVWFLLNAISLSHHCKVKKKKNPLSGTNISQRPSVLLLTPPGEMAPTQR